MWYWCLVPSGSPPLTWRTLLNDVRVLVAYRITSTYVENTYVCLLRVFRIKDHLHLRGEHTVLDLACLVCLGSPPLTWRTPNQTVSALQQTRITSTYVENTEQLNDIFPLFEDHLHLRGEHLFLHDFSPFVRGSPPRTWRTLIVWSGFFCVIRITSTYVENTNYPLELAADK